MIFPKAVYYMNHCVSGKDTIMNRKPMRHIAILMALILSVSMLAGCSGKDKAAEGAYKVEPAGLPQDFEGGSISIDQITASAHTGNVYSEGARIYNASYIMIYNPYVWQDGVDDDTDTTNDNIYLYTGDISSSIVTGSHRAGLDEEPLPFNPTPGDLTMGVEIETQEGNRASFSDPVYKKGDVVDFWHFNVSVDAREKDSFTCVYEGKFCYIWSMNNRCITESQAEVIGREFDAVAYPNDLAAFEVPRFTENGGKINILYYPMTDSYGGFFWLYDNFATGEVPESYVESIGLNLDHAIINMNPTFLTNGQSQFALSSLPHELQHQICCSDMNYMGFVPDMDAWLDETMSAYAEEISYPGAKGEMGYQVNVFTSNNIRTGMSLQNFDYRTDPQIGAYGNAYLFGRMMTRMDPEIFGKVHSNWRMSFNQDYSEANVLYDSATKEMMDFFGQQFWLDCVNENFRDESENYLSNLTWWYHVSCFNDMEFADMLEYDEGAVRASMLYMETNGVNIQPGGRIIVAVSGDYFEIPEDASVNLVYTCFDSDFNVVNNFVGTP